MSQPQHPSDHRRGQPRHPYDHARTKRQALGGACRCGCTCRNFGSDAERKRLLEAGKQLAIDFLIETKGVPGAKVNLNLDIDPSTTVETRLSSHGWLGHKMPEELETDLEQHAFSAAYFAWMSGFFEQTLRKILEKREAAKAATGVTPRIDLATLSDADIADHDAAHGMTTAADLLRAMATANERELAALPPRDTNRDKSVSREIARETRAKLLLAHAIIEGAGIDAKHTHSLFVDFSGTNLGEVMIQAQHDGPRNASKIMLRIPGIAAGIRAAITKYLRSEIQG